MAGCHDINGEEKVPGKQNTILLMGNPNVGKSVFFSDMTGIQVVSSTMRGPPLLIQRERLNWVMNPIL